MEDDLNLEELPPRDMPAARAESIRRLAQARLARSRLLAAEAARAPRPTPMRLRLELAVGTAFSVAHVAWGLVTVLG